MRFARPVVWIPQARRGDWRVGSHAGKTGKAQSLPGADGEVARLPPNLSKRFPAAPTESGGRFSVRETHPVTAVAEPNEAGKHTIVILGENRDVAASGD